MSLTVLFMLLFGLFIASYRALRGRIGGAYHCLSPPYMRPSRISTASPSGPNLQEVPVLGGGQGQGLDKWVTRLFIAIVLQCAALYLMSQLPGVQSPFWLGIVLQGYSYGSAALFYASGNEGSS